MGVILGKEKYHYDVVVCGGGIAGISCAYNCAKLDLKTLLLEKDCHLGGDITSGLVIPVMKTDDNNINNDFFNALIKESQNSDAQITYGDNNKGWFNPVLLQNVFEKILRQAKCDILFESEITSAIFQKNNINEVTVNTNMLSLPIVSKYYVDSTGDASLSKILNCEFWTDTENFQPESLRFFVSGVNLENLSNFLLSIDSDKNVTTTYRIDGQIHLSTAYTWDTNKKWALDPYFKAALADKVLKQSDLAYFQIFTVAKMPNTVAFNCPRLSDYNKNDVFGYTNAIIEAREAILRIHKFVKRYIKGFENSYISNIASKVGKRQTKRVKCKYDYKIDDILNSKIFENPVLYSDYPIDIHSNKKNSSKLISNIKYSLPIESLMAKDFDNLFIAGKIAGTDFMSQGALRVQSSCMSMGEGIAKYIKQNVK